MQPQIRFTYLLLVMIFLKNLKHSPLLYPIQSSSGTDNITLLVTSVKGTITNDDGSELSIADASLIEGADGATSKMQFTVTAFPTPENDLTATWTTSVADDDTAISDVDFTSATGTVRIAATTTTDTFEIDILGDNTPEFNETFTVNLSNPSADARVFANTGSAQGTINNDDGTGLRVEANKLEEGGIGATPNLQFTVTTVPPSSSTITYQWETSTESGDTAIADTDYSISSGSENIAANAPNGTFSVPLIGDDDPEPDETFTVTISNPSGATILTNSATGTIVNDDGSILSIANVDLIEGVAGSTSKMIFTVTADPPAISSFTVDWATSDESDDTATENVDYTKASGTLDFAIAEASETFEVEILGDNTPEFNETFTVSLSNAGIGSVVSSNDGSARGIINNDDGTGLRIESVSMDEGADTETTNMEFQSHHGSTK